MMVFDLGLINKLFDNITAWTNFEALNPSSYNTKIYIKADKIEILMSLAYNKIYEILYVSLL
jgi:hypothetical protein